MKKVLSLFCVAVMLTASLCVPAFAVEESGVWVPIFSGSSTEWNDMYSCDVLSDPSLGIDLDSQYRVIVDGVASDPSVFVYNSGYWGLVFSHAYCSDCFSDTLCFDFADDGSVGLSNLSFHDVSSFTLEKFSPDSMLVPDISIVGFVTSGVNSSVSWVSTFANTIVTTPILLLSAILAFIGFGIGIFKRLRT